MDPLGDRLAGSTGSFRRRQERIRHPFDPWEVHRLAARREGILRNLPERTAAMREAAAVLEREVHDTAEEIRRLCEIADRMGELHGGGTAA